MASCQEVPEWSQTRRKVPWEDLAWPSSGGSWHNIGCGTVSPGGRPWAALAEAAPCWWCTGWRGCRRARRGQKAEGWRGRRTTWDLQGLPEWRCLPACQSPCLWCCCYVVWLLCSEPAGRRTPAAASTGSQPAPHERTWLPAGRRWWGSPRLPGPRTWDRFLGRSVKRRHISPFYECQQIPKVHK